MKFTDFVFVGYECAPACIKRSENNLGIGSLHLPRGSWDPTQVFRLGDKHPPDSHSPVVPSFHPGMVGSLCSRGCLGSGFCRHICRSAGNYTKSTGLLCDWGSDFFW